MHDVDRVQQFLEAGLPSQEAYGYEAGPMMESGFGQFESGPYETGPYETGPYETGSYETGPYETGPYETGQYEAGQYESGPYETGSYETGPYETGQYEAGGQYEYSGEIYGEIPGEIVSNPMTGEISTDVEIGLAAELLSVGSERELDQFFGKFIRGLGKSFKKFAGSGLGKTLFTALKPLAKAALPTLGGALGSLIPIPGVGTAVGAWAANQAGNALGLEFQGLSNEDRDLEIARRIIRTGIDTARYVESLPEGEVNMEEEVWDAVKSLAARALPGAVSLLTSGLSASGAAGTQGTGGLGGGLSVRSPGGWSVDLGGQAGGQVTTGATVGVNAAPPPVPFQPSPAGQVMPQPYQAGRVGPAYGGGRPAPGPYPTPRGRHCPPSLRMHGRWFRRGRAIVVLGLC